MTSWGHDTLAQTHAHMTSICSSISGSETSPTLLKFSRFSAQISRFSADIVKQRPNNAEIWADSVLYPVITVEWVNISSTGTGSAKIGCWKMEKNRGFGDPESS